MMKFLPFVIRYFSIFLFVIISLTAKSQIPTTQDCLGAIAVCDYIYVEEFTATGQGNYPNEIPLSQVCPNHCMNGERNTRWYQWTVVESGDLRLTITPATQSDDYDWAVFNLSDHHCEDIYNSAIQMMVSCNAAGGAGYHGNTGISTLNGAVASCNNGGTTNKWSTDVPVYEGESYVLVVSDWTQSPGGYTLDFSSSTAVIFDDQQPFIDYLGGDEITACGTNELHITFNENVKCSSIQRGDFVFSGPGGPYTIDSIYGQNCDLGGNNERDYYLYFTPAIYQPGEYFLEIKSLSFISDPCNNYAEPGVYSFDIDLDAPEANAGDDIDIFTAGTATLDGSGIGGSGFFNYHWEPADMLDDPNIANPTTVSLVVSTQFILEVSDNVSTCVNEDTMWVNVIGAPLSVSASVDNSTICQGDIVNIFAFPDGGSEDYTYSWTSDPVGFISSQQNPSDFPNNDITYIVEVDDGYGTISASVSVEVNPKPIALAGEDIEIDLGTTATLDGSASGGSGNYQYRWEPASWLEQNEIPNPETLLLPETTLFTLIITDANSGCISEVDEMHVIVSSDVLSASPYADPQELCYGQSTTISALPSGGGGGYEYEWTVNGNTVSSSEMFTDSPEVSTRYNLHLSDQFGNDFQGHIDVVVHPLPVIDLVPDNYPPNSDTITVCVRDSVWLDAGYDDDPEGSTYFWTNENYQNRYLKAHTNGTWIDFQTHKVIVEHPYDMVACQDSGQITIIFDFNECAISVPETVVGLEDAISILPNPNNGNFIINLSKPVNDLSLKVYDIRGSLIYEKFMEGKYDTNHNHQISTGINDRGVYLIVLQTGGEWFLQKMVVN